MNARAMHMEFERKVGQFSQPDFPMPFLSHEVEDFLNESQDIKVKNLYVDFEQNEKARTELGPLINNVVITTFVTGAAYCHTNGHMANVPTGVQYPVKESCNVVYSDCNDNTGTKEVKVMPITHDEYLANIDNPYRKPYIDLIWRIDMGASGTSYKRHELVTDGSVSITNYMLRYIKRPTAISIINNTTCELDPSVHDDIVDLAASIALKTRPQLQETKQNNES